MTDLAGALANTDGLGELDGKDILRTTIAITNAGDGLSEALKIDPVIMHHGDRVYVVLECEVTKVSFPMIKDTDALSRVHTLKAGTATIIDGDLVKAQIEAQQLRIDRAREAAKGVTRLPTEDELEEAHRNGEHDDALVAGCVMCEDVVAADDESTE